MMGDALNDLDSSSDDGQVEGFAPPTLDGALDGAGFGLAEEPSGDFTTAGFANEAPLGLFGGDGEDDDDDDDWEDESGDAAELLGLDGSAQETDAAAKIQSMQRGKLARKELNEQKDAAVKIQAVQRGKKSRKGGGGKPPAAAPVRLELEPEPEQYLTPEDELAAIEAENEKLKATSAARDAEFERLTKRLAQLNGEAATARKPVVPSSPRSARKRPGKAATSFNEGLYQREKAQRQEKMERLAARKQQYLDEEMDACPFTPIMVNKADGSCAVLPPIKATGEAVAAAAVAAA